MQYIDLHCDTLSVAYFQKAEDMWSMPYAMVDIERLKKANAMAQFFAIYLRPLNSDKVKSGEIPGDDIFIEKLSGILMNSIRNHNEVIEFASGYESFQKNLKESKISAFLTLEEGRSVDGDFGKLKKYHDMGVRLITLTWNFPNCFGYPNSPDPEIMNMGLTSFGKDAIEYMNDLGIIIDVSHLSDGGFSDVAAISKKPFIASHSNCRALSPHPRNLTDEMIRILADKGGVMGLNFYPSFLNEDIRCPEGTIDIMARHVLHMINTGGIECVAIGTDFDGIDGNLEINEPTKVDLLFARLKREGISDSQLEKIAFGNAIRVIKESIF